MVETVETNRTYYELLNLCSRKHIIPCICLIFICLFFITTLSVTCPHLGKNSDIIYVQINQWICFGTTFLMISSILLCCFILNFLEFRDRERVINEEGVA